MALIKGVSFAAQIPPYATLNADGTITCFVTLGAKSEVTIYATATGSTPAIIPRATTVSVSPSASTIQVENGTVQLLASVADQFGNLMSPQPLLVWSTSDPVRTSVSQAGLVTGIQTGASATITAVVSGTTVQGSATVATPSPTATTLTINAGFSTLAAAAAAQGMHFGYSFNTNDESHPNYSQLYQQTAGSGGSAAFEIWHNHWFGGGTAFTGLGLSGVSLNFQSVAAAEIARLQAQGTPIQLTYPIDEGVNTGWSSGISNLVTNAAQAIQMAQTMVALNMSFFVPKALGTVYSNTTTYTVGTLVSLSGANYLCIKNGTVGISPPNTTNWLPYPVSTITAWNSATAYVPGNIVTNGGHTYTCWTAHTNHAPPNFAFWIQTEQGVIDTCIPVNEVINNSGFPNSNNFQHWTTWSAATLVANAILWCYAADPTIRKFGMNNGHGEKNSESGQRTAGLNLLNGVISALSGIVPASQLDYGYEGHVDCQGMQSSGGNFDTANFINWIDAIQATGASFSVTEFDVTDLMSGTVAQRQQFVGLAYTNMLNALSRATSKPDRFVCWQDRCPETWLAAFIKRSDGLPMWPNPYADFNLTALPAQTALVTWFTNNGTLQNSITINDALPHQIPASLSDQWGFPMSLSNATWTSTNPTHIPVSSGGVVQCNAGGQTASVTAAVPGTGLSASITVTTSAAAATALSLSPGSVTTTAPVVQAAQEVDQFGNVVGSTGAGPVAQFAAAATGLSANITAVASTSSTLWAKGRIRVDDLRNLPLSSGCGLLSIDSDGAGTNKKFEVYVQTGSTAFVELSAAPYNSAGARIAVLTTPFVALTAFPANGNYVEWFASVNMGTGAWQLGIFDASGNVINDGSHSSTASGTTTVTPLNTTGGANGRVTVNKGFNANATAKALTHDGVAIYNGTPPALGATTCWTKPLAGDTGIIAGWYMGDSSSGSLASLAAFVGGQALTTSGTVTGALGDTNDWTAGTGVTVNWSSDNTAVATVSPSSGTQTTVTPVTAATGVANITASVPNALPPITGTAVVSVQSPPAPASLVVTPKTSSLSSGQTAQYQAAVSDQFGNVMPPSAYTLAWTSSNTAVATVNGASGLVSFVAAGTATITATVQNTTPAVSGTATVTCVAAAATNEPAGTTVLIPGGIFTAVPTSGQTFGASTFTMFSAAGGSISNGGNSANLTTVPSAEGTGLRVIYPSDPTLHGASPVRFGFSLPGGGKTLYIRVRIRYSTNWTNGGNVGTKICEPQFINNNNAGVNGAGSDENHVIGMFCDPGDPTSAYLNVDLQFPNGTESFRDIPAAGNSTWALTEPNGQLAGPTRGNWHTIELLFTPQSSVTATTVTADGGCKTWVDNSQVANASDVTWVGPGDSQLWGYLLFDPTYGGGTNFPPNVSPFIHWDFDQLYVSTKP